MLTGWVDKETAHKCGVCILPFYDSAIERQNHHLISHDNLFFSSTGDRFFPEVLMLLITPSRGRYIKQRKCKYVGCIIWGKPRAITQSTPEKEEILATEGIVEVM